jgi:hypothetical protein
MADNINSIIPLVALWGEELVGLELGVASGDSLIAIIRQCPNIKTMHAVDSWRPYTDYLKAVGDGKPACKVSETHAKNNKLLTYDKIKHSGLSHKIVVHEKDTKVALKSFPKESLDFIWMDAYLTYKQAVGELKDWYPKLKKGGLFTGHDWHCDDIRKAVLEFRSKNNIRGNLVILPETWSWRKS